MKIKSYELFQVPPRWLFLKIVTDDGLVGWGEPVIEGKAATVKTAVEELMEQLIGKDAMNIEDHWNFMYRNGFYRGGPILMSAIAGIDQALWDIKGKFYNAPIHQLLGGKARDIMKVYSWIGGDRPAEAGRSAVACGDPAIPSRQYGRAADLRALPFTVCAVAPAFAQMAKCDLGRFGSAVRLGPDLRLELSGVADERLVFQPVRLAIPRHDRWMVGGGGAWAVGAIRDVASGDHAFGRIPDLVTGCYNELDQSGS